jgi:hypothetical protein
MGPDSSLSIPDTKMGMPENVGPEDLSFCSPAF